MLSVALAVLRLALAVVFVAHGANELFGTWADPGIGPGGLRNAAATLDRLNLHPSLILAAIVGGIDVLGGTLLGLGLFSRGAAVLLAAVQAVELWKLHLRWGFFLNWTGVPERGHGVEYTIVLIAGLVCLALAGPGELSLDGHRAKRRAARAAGRARLRGV